MELPPHWIDFDKFKERFLKEPVEIISSNKLDSSEGPVVSVLLITYNHEHFISKAIDSILSQRVNFVYELVIGDDESIDNTLSICLEYYAKFPEVIRIIKHKSLNRISVLGRQCGIFQIAYNLFSLRGRYIAILSGDDYWGDNSKLQKQFDFMETNRWCSYVYHSHISLDLRFNVFGPEEITGRIQTILGRNVFHYLPIHFINVIQEDTFLKCIWSLYGMKYCLNDVKPSVYIRHDDSLFSTSGVKVRFDHQVNVRLNLISAFTGVSSEIVLLSKMKLVEVLVNYYLKEYRGLHGYIKLFVSLFRYQLFRVSIKYFFDWINRSFK